MKNPIVLLALMLATFGSFAKSKIVHRSDFALNLGDGWLKDDELQKAKCVQGTTSYSNGIAESDLNLSSTISQQQLEKDLGIAAGGRYRTGASDLTASANFARSSKSSGYSITMIYRANYSFKPKQLKDLQWTNIAKRWLKPEIVDGRPDWTGAVSVKNKEQFNRMCGDEFVISQQLGAKFFFSIRIDFSSQQEKEEFAAQFSFRSPAVDISAKVRNAMEKASKSATVSVNVLQVGGRVEKMSQIFHKPIEQGGENNAYEFVRCSSGQLQNCLTVIAGAIAYATDVKSGFPSQIRPEDLQNPNLASGPSVLNSITGGYELVGLVDAVSDVAGIQIKRARARILYLYEEVYNQWTEVIRIDELKLPRLSPRQEKTRASMQSTLFLDIQKLVEASESCFEDRTRCISETAVVEPDEPGGITLYSKEDLAFPAETFIQYCDLAIHRRARVSITKTVESLIEVAKRLNSDVVGSDDICSMASAVLSSAKSLDLSGMKLGDLAPLTSFQYLTELKINDVGLDVADLEVISNLKNLRFLHMERNGLSDVSPLRKLTQLVSLSLAGNEIEDAGSLEDLYDIEFLDLSNNHPGIECPFEDATKCVLADYRRNNEFVGLDKDNYIPRVDHQASLVSRNEILVVGGPNSTRSEIYDIDSQSFRKEGAGKFTDMLGFSLTSIGRGQALLFGGHMAVPALLYDKRGHLGNRGKKYSVLATDLYRRAGHRAISLNDGRVLITGGYKVDGGLGSRSRPVADAVIFNPNDYSFEKIGSMNVPRHGHTMSRLESGHIVIAGGQKIGAAGKPEGIGSIEIFDPTSNRFTSMARMNFPRYAHTATVVGERVYFIGGSGKNKGAIDSIEIFDTKFNKVRLAQRSLKAKRAGHQAIEMDDGKILLIGGLKNMEDAVSSNLNCQSCLDSAEVFDTDTESISAIHQKMTAPRAFFSLTKISGDRWLILGGLGRAAPYTAELFVIYR